MTYHVILLVIASNNILLNPLMALTYYLVSDSSSFQYTKPHLLIVENLLCFIALLKYINPLFYCSFNFYLQTSYLLGCNLPSLDPIRDLGFFLKLYNYEVITGLSHS